MKSSRFPILFASVVVLFLGGCRANPESSYGRMFATAPDPQILANYKNGSQKHERSVATSSLRNSNQAFAERPMATRKSADQIIASQKLASKYLNKFPNKTDAESKIKLASYSQDSLVEPAEGDWFADPAHESFNESASLEVSNFVGQASCDSFPIDLASSLQLAGASNWALKIARERVRESKAQYMAANLMWLPSLQLGIGYNGHEGRIQDTQGNVIDVSRHSLFAGGGARVGNSPIAGGSGGPLRMAVDLSLADTIFEPLARCQLLKAQQAAADSAFNDIMMETGIAYYELMRSEARVAMTRQNLADAAQMVSTFNSFIEAGKGAEVDNVRGRVIERTRQQEVLEAEGQRAVAAARLARLLQMDPSKVDPQCGLTVMDAIPYPVELIHENDLNILISQAISSRPEMAQTNAVLNHAGYRLAAERWRPAIPHVSVGGSGGGFGGGPGTQFPDFKGRADLDVIVAWEVKNMGFGNEALRRERSSQRRQAEFQMASTRDQVASEVSQAYFESNARRRQIELAQMTIQDAQKSLDANVQRIRALEGSPLELIQAIESLASSRGNYLNTVIEFNQSQLRLLRAVGSTM